MSGHGNGSGRGTPEEGELRPSPRNPPKVIRPPTASHPPPQPPANTGHASRPIVSFSIKSAKGKTGATGAGANLFSKAAAESQQSQDQPKSKQQKPKLPAGPVIPDRSLGSGLSIRGAASASQGSRDASPIDPPADASASASTSTSTTLAANADEPVDVAREQYDFFNKHLKSNPSPPPPSSRGAEPSSLASRLEPLDNAFSDMFAENEAPAPFAPLPTSSTSSLQPPLPLDPAPPLPTDALPIPIASTSKRPYEHVSGPTDEPPPKKVHTESTEVVKEGQRSPGTPKRPAVTEEQPSPGTPARELQQVREWDMGKAKLEESEERTVDPLPLAGMTTAITTDVETRARRNHRSPITTTGPLGPGNSDAVRGRHPTATKMESQGMAGLEYLYRGKIEETSGTSAITEGMAGMEAMTPTGGEDTMVTIEETTTGEGTTIDPRVTMITL
ncbi:hypothetical protein MNV49_005797 [Pseudohyphozyma bogoriensis]|nr:hypothetical protein MNV49_005797 [Pseudohyphozyma bogoriensis]